MCSEKKLLLIEDYYSGKCLKSCHRSIESGWGYDVVEVVFRPQDIVEWSENYKIEMPEALKDVVKSIYNPENWQEKYKQLQNKVKILEQQLANISKPQISLKELAEIEKVLDVKTEKTYDRVLATVALSFIKQKNDLNGTRIESIINKISEQQLEELNQQGLNLPSRKPLTKYLKKPRKLLGLEEIASFDK